MEVWKDVIGYEGFYQVSNKGNVKSLSWRNTGTVRNLTPKVTNRGYSHVHLYSDGIPKSHTIHRLVALHFIKNPLNYPVINHKDENPSNNHAENLEWCDQSYNTLYSMSKCRGRAVSRNRGVPYKQTPKIEQRTLSGDLVRVWVSFVAIKHSINRNESSIRDCCNGKRRQAYGFKWAYAHQETPLEKAV